jgi:hypothetical protein
VGNPPFVGGKRISTMAGEAYKDWLQEISTDGNANADLVAHFFRRSFDLLRLGGSLGLIATNTIAQGDTRSTGLRWICLNGGTIYAARKRYKWPGVAAVVVSVVHLLKGTYSKAKLLEGRPVAQITAFLFAKGGHEDPKRLAANAGKSFQGSIVLSMGFTFDDSGLADDETPGIPSPITTMERLIAENPKNAEVIFPYIGGDEVNKSPTHAHHRYVIDFGERNGEDCRREWPDLMRILECKVMPERLSKSKEISTYPWWHHWRPRPELYSSIGESEVVLANLFTSSTHAFSMLASKVVFANSLNVFPLQGFGSFACLQARLHELWTKFFSSTMGDGIRYTPSDCFSPFPFPSVLLESLRPDSASANHLKDLEALGEHYHQFRAELMVSNNEGLTSTYNRFHDPSETSSGLLEMRRLHGEMDQAVLNAYQ